ncbi:MAG TPA: hypothetical protein VI702_03400, partial [Nitrospiria bacterium]
LFGETPSRIVVTLHDRDMGRLQALCEVHRVPMIETGRVEGNRLIIRPKDSEKPLIDIPVSEMRSNWEGAIESYFKGQGDV